jgi:hypothetical protein
VGNGLGCPRAHVWRSSWEKLCRQTCGKCHRCFIARPYKNEIHYRCPACLLAPAHHTRRAADPHTPKVQQSEGHLGKYNPPSTSGSMSCFDKCARNSEKPTAGVATDRTAIAAQQPLKLLFGCWRSRRPRNHDTAEPKIQPVGELSNSMLQQAPMQEFEISCFGCF